MSLLVLMASFGCSKKEEAAPVQEAPAPTSELNIYIWADYIPEEMLTRFTEETGIRVTFSTYTTNEEMYEKVVASKGRYDLIFPSSYVVNKMRKESLLVELDHKKLPNFRNLNTALLDKPYDPGNRFSVPYLWGSTGIAVNKKYVDPASVTSWNDLWRPEFKGKILLIDDMRDLFHIGLKTLAYQGSDTNLDHLKAAYEKLKTLMPSVAVVDSESPRSHLTGGAIAVGVCWSGDAYIASKTNPDITFIYPKEGAIFWVDSMAIPVGARNIESAHKFIEYVLRPENAALISEQMGYASPNITAVEMMDESLTTNPVLYPPSVEIEKGEFLLDVGDAILMYDRYWRDLMSLVKK